MNHSTESDRMFADPDRAEQLATAVHNHIAQGWRVESQTPTSATLVKGGNTSHGVHLFATLITAGMWAPVWVWRWYANRRQVLGLTVDEYGNVNPAKLA
ncbi:MAG: hypothetical protein ACRDQD_01080 [Nocardioidaceae bacterium]